MLPLDLDKLHKFFLLFISPSSCYVLKKFDTYEITRKSFVIEHDHFKFHDSYFRRSCDVREVRMRFAS